MTVLLGLYVTVGLLLAALAVPLVLRKVGPNSWYGFRVRRTLDDPALWYPVNVFAAKGLLAVGLATSMAAICFYFLPGVDLVLYALAVSAVTLGGLAVNLVLSFRYYARLAGKSGTDDPAGQGR